MKFLCKFYFKVLAYKKKKTLQEIKTDAPGRNANNKVILIGQI